CSAVVQFDTAQANGAPTNAANSRSNAATSGPCVSHPVVSGPRTASISACPSVGRAIGIARSCAAVVVVVLGIGCRLSLLAPPGDEAADAVLEGEQRPEGELRQGHPLVRQPHRH